MKLVIPRKAMPAVTLIREAKKPRGLPKSLCVKGLVEYLIHYDKRVLRWRRGSNEICPMGLIPGATCGVVVTPDQVQGRLTWLNIKSFYDWWDEIEQKDAKRAIIAIWG